MKAHQIWTEEETNTLLEHWKDYTQRDLHNKFLPDKTPVQICQKKMRMGLKGRRIWSEEERELLLEHGADYSQREMVSKFLPNKTPRQVTDMRKYFGIKRRIHRAAGIVPYIIKESGELRFLLIKGSFGWEFPKGHIEKEETSLEAAKRETEEETGLTIEEVHPSFRFLSKYLVTINYSTREKLDNPIPKTVAYFLGKSPTKEIKLSFEHSEYGWFTPSEAMEKLSKNKREVLKAALCKLN